MGGLGNQIFQVTAAYSHAKNNNDTPCFNLNYSHTPLQGENIIKYKDILFKEFCHDEKVLDKCTNVYSEKKHSYDNIPYTPNQQLQGYFQSEKYFHNHKEEIIDKLLKGLRNYDKWDEITQEINNLKGELNKPIVSLHVRRGDYLKNPHIHPPCSVSYYNNAIDYLKENLGDFMVYFVSDDIRWCKETFGDGHLYSNYTDELDDLVLMVNSDHYIIANSTFSWWGAYMGINMNKIIIAPNIWFGVGGPKDQEDIIPKNWIKI
jgi:hypothetical protein